MRTHGDQEILADDIMLGAGSRHCVNQAADILTPDFFLQFAGQIIVNADRDRLFNCLHSGNTCPGDGIWQAATGGGELQKETKETKKYAN
jgi:hypothetical protein